MLRCFVFLATVLLVVGVCFGYYVALPAASHFLTNYDKRAVQQSLIRARDYIGFAAKVLRRDGDRLRAAALRRRADAASGSSTTRTAAPHRRIGYFVVCCIAVALPGVDPVTTIFETIPLLVLYEVSIWLSVLLDRRAGAPRRRIAVGT